MSEYLLTLDQRTYSPASDLRVVPGETIVQRERMFGSGQAATAQATKKMPGRCSFRTGTPIPNLAQATILTSDGSIYFLSGVTIVVGTLAQGTRQYTGLIEEEKTHSGENLAEVKRIFREHAPKKD